MYHTRFKGTHYEIGYRYGSLLFSKGKYILENVPFEITQERMDYAESCLPYYRQWFPSILEEIQGLADGQQCDFNKLAGVLLTMYCIVPQQHCSCFAVRNKQGTFFGRNSDFLTNIEKLCTNSIYRFTDQGYGFTGNTTAFVEMEDGINERGLAIGLTSVYPSVLRPGLNAGLILRLVLEQCKDVKEAIELLKRLPNGSSHTFVLADRSGAIALVESNTRKTVVDCPEETNAYVSAVNMFCLPDMIPYNHALNDNWQADERYLTMEDMLSKQAVTMTAEDCMDLLAGKYGFMCQYDRRTGKDTVWSVVCDMGAGTVYRVEGNPGRKRFREDKRFSMI